MLLKIKLIKPKLFLYIPKVAFSFRSIIVAFIIKIQV